MLRHWIRILELTAVVTVTLVVVSTSIQQRLGLEKYSGSRRGTGSAYHRELDAVRDVDRAPHSRTLGVAQRIYAISLPHRVDRRNHMETLATAMDIGIIWHDALDMHSRLVTQILERVRWARAQSRIGHETDVPDVQGLRFTWSPDVGSDAPVLLDRGADVWSSLKELDAPPSPDGRAPLLRIAGEDMLLPGEVITRAQVSCWYSHYQVLLKIARGQDQVAIVLEDDVDMEWDLERRLRQMWPFLPDKWDIVMLGHCMSDESKNPSVRGHPHLHPSTHVLCTHAYAVSRSGARRLVRYLRTPLFAFSRPIDHAIQHLNHHKLLNVYSVEPPVIIQTKRMNSDIVDGTGGNQTEWLVDSVLERVARYGKHRDRLAHV